MKEDVEIEFDYAVKEPEGDKSMQGLTADLDSDREKRFEIQDEENVTAKKKGKIPVPVMAAMALFVVGLVGGVIYLATSSQGEQPSTDMSMATDVSNPLAVENAGIGQSFDAGDNSQVLVQEQPQSGWVNEQNAPVQEQMPMAVQDDPFALIGEQQVQQQPPVPQPPVPQPPVPQPSPQQEVTLSDPVTVPEQVAQTQPNMSFDEINNRVNAAYALFNDISQRLDAMEKKNSEPKNSVSSPASKQELVEALSVLRSLQAQIKVQNATIASLKSQIQGGKTTPTTVAVRSTSNAQSTVSTQPQMYAATAAPVTTSRGGKELAWASYIENYGVAKVDGSSDLVVLRPGDSIVGRGVIDSINQYGCIIFVNGSRYAPVNGACN